MAAQHVNVRGKWKDVDIQPSVFVESDFSGFVSMQELTDYTIVTHNGQETSSQEIREESMDTGDPPAVDTDSVAQPVKKKKKWTKSKKNKKKSEWQITEIEPAGQSDEQAHTPQDQPTHQDQPTNSRKRKSSLDESLDGQVSKIRKVDNAKNKKGMAGEPGSKGKKSEGKLTSKVDMSAWSDLCVPPLVLKALRENGFTAPTPIQALCLLPAIKQRRDIVGAAETGSGKTLAFGIPVIAKILELKEQLSTKAVVNSESSDDGEGSDKEEGSDSNDGDTAEHSTETMNSPLYTLILTPTRELAIQVRDHILVAAKYTNIQVVAIVGGMAPQKQARLLKKCPEIVVATPGRLWELLQEGNSHLNKVHDISCLVIDEADRMVEKGHFQELSLLLQLLNRDEEKQKKRQSYIFSATLTMVHSGPQRLKFTKKNQNISEKEKLDILQTQVGVKAKPFVVDLTRPVGTVESLSEARIHCSMEEKDFYLYYFLQQYPGRTLVFANSKDCIRRLVSIFTVLQCCPLSLHADMHQRQRLKNLDRFKGNPRGLLLATDVAARGLDIPDVQHVIHYQVPRTTENYVHRSGRTARASKEGLSIMFVDAKDLQNYRKIMTSLKRDGDLPYFSTEQDLFNEVKLRVELARDIDAEEHKTKKQHHHNLWYQKAAKEMDIELDEDLLVDEGTDTERSQLNQKLQYMRQDMKMLLKRPISQQRYQGKYPTKSGKLNLPVHSNKDLKATSAVKATKAAGTLKNKKKRKHNMHKRGKSAG